MAKTNIAWTDFTWNIARGCTKVDDDCKFCYMYRDSYDKTRYNPTVVTRTKKVFKSPLTLVEPSKIFASSLTDFYHTDCDDFRPDAWNIIRQCPQHTFQLLTKRPERIEANTPPDLLQAPNIWFGTSIGSNKGLHRLTDLLAVPCRTRFVSFEPLHECISLQGFALNGLHWAIIGGESGNDTGQYRYRPCQIDWMEQLITQLPLTPVFVKQMGTYLAKQLNMSDRHGKQFDEFPASLQIREFPVVQP